MPQFSQAQSESQANKNALWEGYIYPFITQQSYINTLYMTSLYTVGYMVSINTLSSVSRQ